MTTATTGWGDVARTLELELGALVRVLRLTGWQRRRMVRRDATALESTLVEMQSAVDRVQTLYQQRVEQLSGLGIDTPGREGLKSATLAADNEWRERIVGLEAALARVMERLARKNLQNHQLTRFSQDLVGEEMRLLLGAADRPGTTYDAAGATDESQPRGAVDGRA